MSIVHPSCQDGPARFECAQAGCLECQDGLIRQHERLVHHIVRRQASGGLSYDDLLQAGRIGLWQAILHFDVERGIAFSTYAWVAIERKVWQQVARGQPEREVEVDVAPTNWRDMAEEAIGQWQVAKALTQAVAQLPEQPRQILVALYGLDGKPPCSLAELGRKYQMTRQGVSYWRNQALVLLRLPLFSGALRQVYEQTSRGAYARSQALTRQWQRQKRAKSL